MTYRTHARLLSSQFSRLASFSVVSCFCGWIPLCHCSVCQWKPFWIPVGESFQKNGNTLVVILPTNRAWRIFLRWCRVLATKVTSPNQNYLKKYLQHHDQRSNLMPFPWNLSGPNVLQGKELRHHCLLHDPGATSCPSEAAQSFS